MSVVLHQNPSCHCNIKVVVVATIFLTKMDMEDCIYSQLFTVLKFRKPLPVKPLKRIKQCLK